MSRTSPLEELGFPLFHAVDDADLDVPTPHLDRAHRTRVRSLSGMQKEALVTDDSGTTWRLASDEGPYLDGEDVAPSPLAHLTTGMVASFAESILGLADERGIEVRDLELVLDNFYTMTGSALRGDMTGGALDPQVEARIDSPADEATLRALVEDAIERAPVFGLIDGELTNRFSLSLNGDPLAPDRVAELDGSIRPAPGDDFEAIDRDAPERDPPIGRNTGELTEEFSGDREKYTSGESSSLASEQDRVLHLRGICTLGDDGVKEIEVKLFSPQGSIFEFRSEAPEGRGGEGRAPEAMTYVAAGLAFCFMTQFGRYADIVDTELTNYEIVQDTHVAAAGDGSAEGHATASPVETHVFLETPAGEDFARDVLDMSEQTCFLHALCRTDLSPGVSVTPI